MESHTLRHSFFLLILILYSSVAFPQNRDNRLFNDSTLKISEIGINSIHSDFGPFVIQDTLYFTTFNDKLIEKSDWTLRNKEFYDLYMAPIDKQGNIVGNREPVPEFITKFNDGPVTYCPKTGELFVTQNYDDQSLKSKPFHTQINRLRIMVAKRINGQWRHVYEFPYNNPAYSVGHPAVTESGDTLIFSSDRPGGFGETDLYYSIRQNGKWGFPINLGPNINTSGKEEFAFLTDHRFNGQFLIFASKGRFGNGGFDLYYTRFPSDYSDIGHFESPINTKYDDFAMTIPPDADYGYLTSNRPGTGDDDIYKFTFKRNNKPPLPVMPKCRTLYVYDQTSKRPIPGVRILYCDQQFYITDTKGKADCLPCLGNNCEVTASTFGYPEKTKTLQECKMNKDGIVSDTIWMDILVNQKIALKNIYYDFDKWDILPDAARELDLLVSLMKENPGMKVELGSHTDDRGTEPYNLRLSQLRAKSAVDYIVSKGIDQSRIKGTGYGKTQLIHKGVGGRKCTPEENRENRRTEIYIPGFLRGEAVKQEAGDYSNGKPNVSKDYSSFKEHGSILENEPKVEKIPTESKPSEIAPVEKKAKVITIPEVSVKPKGEPAQKVEAAPKVVKTPKAIPASKALKAEKADTIQKIVKTPKALPGSKNPNVEKTATVTPKVVKETPPLSSGAKYYLVLGSFQSEKKALVLVQQLKTEGFEAATSEEPGTVRVVIEYEHLSQAKKTLEALKNKYKGAWILKK